MSEMNSVSNRILTLLPVLAALSLSTLSLLCVQKDIHITLLQNEAFVDVNCPLVWDN